MIKSWRLSLLITKNTKNAIGGFKLRFLLRFSTKSWFQPVRGCGNERGRGWNQEKREELCLDSSIWLKSNSNAYNDEEQVYLKDRFDRRLRWNAHDGSFRKMSRSSDLKWRVQMRRLRCVIKRTPFRSLDRDPMAEMRSTPINCSRYNAPIEAHVLIIAGGPRAHAINAPSSTPRSIRQSWRDETARSSISRGIGSKVKPNLPILGIKSELSDIMVNKGRIHRELRYFREIF